MAQGTGKVLLADHMDVVTSKPGQPLEAKSYTRGQTVEGLSPARIKELNELGVLGTKEKLEGATEQKAPGESKAPKGKGDQTPAGSGTTEGGTGGAGSSGSAAAGGANSGGKPAGDTGTGGTSA